MLEAQRATVKLAKTAVDTSPDSLPVQSLVFVAVGGVATTVHYTVLVMLVEGTGMTAVSASILSFVAGGVTGYLLNYRFTFRSRKRHHEAFLKFTLVATLGLSLNTAIMIVGVERLGVHYLLSQVVATGLTLIWNFTANRSWTFRERANAGH